MSPVSRRTGRSSVTSPVSLFLILLLFGCVSAASFARRQAPLKGDVADLPPVPGTFRVTSLGNSFTGLHKDGYRARMPATAVSLTVAPDGTCYVRSDYDEGGAHGGIAVSSTGKYLGAIPPGHGIEKTSAAPAFAVDGDGSVFFNTGGGVGVRGPGLASYAPDGAREAPHNWPGYQKAAASAKARGAAPPARTFVGLAAHGSTLLAAEKTLGIVRFDSTKQVETGTIPGTVGASRLAVSPDGSALWAQFGGEVRRIDSRTGGTLAKVAAPGVSGIASDATGRLFLVRETDPRRLVYVYDHTGRSAGTFGVPGGVFAPPIPGRWGGNRFEILRGVGTDKSGNLYVLWVGGTWPQSVTLASFAPSGSSWAATPRWTRYGGPFGDSAKPDPEDETLWYTSGWRLKFDAKASEFLPPVATTVDIARFQDDPRAGIYTQGFNSRGTQGVAMIGGKRFVYTGAGGSSEWYRFDAASHGEIAMPAGMLFPRSVQTDRARKDWPTPALYASGKGFYWSDRNGDGRVSDSEARQDVTLAQERSVIVQPNGDLYWFPFDRERSAFRLRCMGLDSAGRVPLYRPEFVEEMPLPPAHDGGPYTRPLTGGYGGFRIDPATGDLFCVRRLPGKPKSQMVLERYTKWLSDPAAAINSGPIWSVPVASRQRLGLQFDYPEYTPEVYGAFALAGDYVFVGEGVSNGVRVYRADNGKPVGRMAAASETGTTMDDPGGMSARKLKDGRYVVVLMAFLLNRNTVYIWKP